VTTGKAFPSPYEFASAEEADALARRAERFQRPAQTVAPSTNGIGGVSRWFNDEDEEDGNSPVAGGSLGARLGGFGGDLMVPGQVGKKRMKGKAGLGYGSEEVIEIDPVSNMTVHELGPADHTQRTYWIGISIR